MPDLLTLDDLPAAVLRAGPTLVRADINVPISGGEVGDTTRLREVKPTLDELLAKGGRLLLASHCGRPRGRPVPELSLRPLVTPLTAMLDRPVAFADDATGDEAREAAASLGPGELCLLENLRFHPGEEANDPGFADELRALATSYVNDAFATAHREHASVAAAATRFEHRAAGRLMVREVEALGRLLESPTPPFVAILGGAKVSGKIETISNLLPRIDRLLVGGGMANTFLRARGLDLGASLVEETALEVAGRLLEQAASEGVEVLLPVDLVVADRLPDPQEVRTVGADEVPGGSMAVDIGGDTRELFRSAVAAAGTVFWNGPVGVFETPPFDGGSLEVAEAVAESSGYSVVGGGETAAVVAQAGVSERIDHVSTGGGAALALLAGAPMPALRVLHRRGSP